MVFRFVIFGITFLVMLGVISCAPRTGNRLAESNIKNVPTPNQTMAYLSGGDSAQMLAESSAICPNPAHCSPSVGMLAVRGNDQILGRCTAFLVAGDLAVTNRHCIPDDLKPGAKSCRDRIVLKFPRVMSYPAEEYPCLEVVETSSPSDTTSVGPDFAVIRIAQKSSRPALLLSRAGMANGQSYRVLKATPSDDPKSLAVSLDSEDCEAVHNSILVPHSQTDLSLNMEVSGCTIAHGNSGSPLVDSQNQVHGIIQMSADLAKTKKYIETSGLKLLDNTLSPMGIVTNFACLKIDSVETSGPSPYCTRPEDANPSPSIENAIIATREEQSIFAKNPQNLTNAFRWGATKYIDHNLAGKIQADKWQRTYVSFPSCIVDGAPLISDGEKANEEITLVIPKVQVSVGLNRNLVISQSQEVSEASVKLVYSPKNLARQGSSRFEFSDMTQNSQGRELKNVIQNAILKACKS